MTMHVDIHRPDQVDPWLHPAQAPVAYPPVPKPVGTWLGAVDDSGGNSRIWFGLGILALWGLGIAYLAYDAKREGRLAGLSGTPMQHALRARTFMERAASAGDPCKALEYDAKARAEIHWLPDGEMREGLKQLIKNDEREHMAMCRAGVEGGR